MEQYIPYIIVAAVIGGVVFAIRKRKTNAKTSGNGKGGSGGRGGKAGRQQQK